jgi:L-asparaginase II
MLHGVPFVSVSRGERIESVHAIAACAVRVDGEVLLALGAIDEPVYLRSAAKPFIAAAVVRAGAAERFGLDDRDLAIMSASHGGEPEHVAAVRALLAKIGAQPEDLQCGAEPPGVLHNNCSGKHAGILALCRVQGSPFAGYLEPGHPAQRAILAFCERVGDDRFGADRLGIDGCGIPVYATSLRRAARSFARFATLTDLAPDDAAALARVRAAMIAEPFYVAGTDRFDTDLLRAGGGRIVGKAGAEGVHASALLELGAGLVLKVVDGTRRAAAPAAIALLARLGALDAMQVSALGSHASFAVKNVAGKAVGTVAALGGN